VLDDVSGFTGTVTGFSAEDAIDLGAINTAGVSFEREAISGVLEVRYGTDAGSVFALDSSYSASDFSVLTDANNHVDVVYHHFFAPPTITGDLFVTAVKGSGVALDVSDFHAVDPDTAAADLTFTVGQTAYHGHLLNTHTGLTLGAGASFTEADLESHYISYVADAVYTGQNSNTSGQD